MSSDYAPSMTHRPSNVSHLGLHMSQGPNLSHVGPIGQKPSNINQLRHKDQPHVGAGSAMKGKFNVFHLTRYGLFWGLL